MLLLQAAAVEHGQAGVDHELGLGVGQTTPGNVVNVNISPPWLQALVESYKSDLFYR